MKQIHKEQLRVSTEKQFQLNVRLRNEESVQMQKVWVVDSLDNMPQQQNQFILEQLQVQQKSQQIFVAMLENANKN